MPSLNVPTLGELWLKIRRPTLAKSLKSVVQIEIELGGNNKATGTGFVIADDVVITCKHVLKGASKIKVNTPDGRTFDVRHENITPGIVADMALLDIQGLGLEPLPIETSLPTVNDDRRVFVPSRGKNGLRLSKGRLSFTNTDELIFQVPNLSDITQQREMALVIKPSQAGDSGSPVMTIDGKVRLMVNAYSESAVVRFTDNPNSKRALALFYVTFCARMDSILKDAQTLGLTE